MEKKVKNKRPNLSAEALAKAETKDKRPKGKAPKKAKAAELKDLSIPIYSAAGKEVGTFVFSKNIFTGEVNKDILYQAVLMYNSNKRQGNASTKTRGDVSGGGKKPWRQKGTGRARAGSSRSPLWRGGGVIFGPHPRDFHYDIPRKMKRIAFLSSINSKLNENKVIGIDFVSIAEPKTKIFRAILEALKLKGKSLFVVGSIDENIMRATGNLEEVFVKNYKDFSTMDVLACDNLVMSKVALEKLPERFKQ